MLKYFYLFFSILFFGNSTFAQELETGSILNDSTDINGVEVKYESLQNPEVTNAVYETSYKVYDSKRKLLYTLILSNNKNDKKLTITEKGEWMTATKTIDFKDSEIDYIITNTSDLNLDITSYSPYDFIISFADSSRSYPFLHRYKTDDDKYLLLDKITKLLLRKYKENSQEALIKSAQLKIAKWEAEERRKEQQRINDSIERVERELRAALVLDSLQTDTVLRKVESSANDFLTRFKKDSLYLDGIQKEIQSKISEKIYGEMSEENKRGERYAGPKLKRKREGEGILLINTGSIYDGMFKNDTFENGNVIFKDNGFEYIGQWEERQFIGKGRRTDNIGNVEFGRFHDTKFEPGILTSMQGGDLYFGTIENDLRKGFSYQQQSNRSILIGEFANSKLVNGFSKEYINGNNVRFYRTLNGKKTETDIRNFTNLENLFKGHIVSLSTNNNAQRLSTTNTSNSNIEMTKGGTAFVSPNSPYASNPITAEAEKFFVKYFNDSIKILGIQNQLSEKQSATDTLGPEQVERVGDNIFVFDKEGGNNQTNKGLMISDDKYGHKVFLGVFNRYEFKSGQAFLILNNKESYLGSYEAGYAGFGKRYSFNLLGDFEIGQFTSSQFVRGEVRKYKDGCLYIGYEDLGKRNGFGVYINTKGNKSIGIFQNDVLSDGYFSIQLNEMLNTKAYFRKIEGGGKEPISQEEWLKVTNAIEALQKKYMP